jgi:hypothetical protein
MKLYAKLYAYDETNRTAWRFNASPAWMQKHDNGHMVSIGFRVGEDITLRQLKALKATPVSFDDWKHSGCQSRCKRRGDNICQW